MQSVVIRNSLLSGLFAALAATCGKVATTPSMYQVTLEYNIPEQYLKLTVYCIQALAMIFMVTCNALMWSLFSLALAHSKVTLHVTVLNTFSNFVFTASIGWILFGEHTTLLWAIGISMILAGIVLLKEQHDVVTCDKANKKH